MRQLIIVGTVAYALFVVMAAVMLLRNIFLVREKRHVVELAESYTLLVVMIAYNSIYGRDWVWGIGVSIAYVLGTSGLCRFLRRVQVAKSLPTPATTAKGPPG